MLILIDKGLEDQIVNLCTNGALSRLRGITNLVQSHANGQHIVVAPPSICRVLETCPRLSEEHRTTATKMRARFSELAELKNILAIYGELTFTSDSPSFQNGVWAIPVDWIAQHGIEATNLICEDLYDCALSEQAAQDFLNDSDLSKLKLALDHINGGGNNTHRVLTDRALTRQKVSLCVVDSDRAEPSNAAPFGTTAQNCKQVAGAGLYELVCTQGRELENHIPSRLVDRLRPLWQGNVPSTTYVNLERDVPGVSLYADLKSGLKKYDLRVMTGQQIHFWTVAATALTHCNHQCCGEQCAARDSGDCRCAIVDPLGRTLLRDAKDFLTHIDNQNIKRHQKYLPSPNDSFWRSMGRTVAAYGIGVKIPRGI